jgi:hypothetical protein
MENFEPWEKSAMETSSIEHKTQPWKTSNHGRNQLWKHHPLNMKLSHGKLRTKGEISYGNIIH